MNNKSIHFHCHLVSPNLLAASAAPRSWAGQVLLEAALCSDTLFCRRTADTSQPNLYPGHCMLPCPAAAPGQAARKAKPCALLSPCPYCGPSQSSSVDCQREQPWCILKQGWLLVLLSCYMGSARSPCAASKHPDVGVLDALNTKAGSGTSAVVLRGIWLQIPWGVVCITLPSRMCVGKLASQLWHLDTGMVWWTAEWRHWDCSVSWIKT